MKKKPANSLILLTGIFATAIFTSFYFLIPSAVLAIFILLRIFKVARKTFLEFLNGPKRFCRRKGIEIGSGGKHTVEGSILVDIISDFSNPASYKVDYNADAHHLPKTKRASLDYVCASNVLEHLTNPIKAILEWMRILKPGGMLWLKIPDKRKTFDKNRERTKFAHLIINEKHAALQIVCCKENTCKNAQDFWIAVKRENTRHARYL
jgi:predicted SAM-dependent methyltransferase